LSPDRIEREITIAAPVERVWAVLTEPEHVGQWFGLRARNPAAPGGERLHEPGDTGGTRSLLLVREPLEGLGRQGRRGARLRGAAAQYITQWHMTQTAVNAQQLAGDERPDGRWT